MVNKQQRAIVYIDGYNLHYGMREAFRGQYKWLDIQGLANGFLRPDATLVKVKYFTAIVKKDKGARERQEIYFNALKAHCDKLEIHYGHFQLKGKKCPKCAGHYFSYEEKKTDVNIACEILTDAFSDAFDCCYLVSGDSDLVPPVEAVAKHHPNKHTIIAHPPLRKSNELCDAANGWFAISRRRFKNNQLPDVVTSAAGKEISRPRSWG